MTARMMPRHAVLVRLLSAEQREAIERIERLPGESLSAACRRVLLCYVGRADLHREVEPQAVRAARGGHAKAALATIDNDPNDGETR